MRLCFYNPHAAINATGDTVLSKMSQWVGKDKKNLRKHNLKYSFLLNILRDKKVKTAIVVDGADTSFSAVLDKWGWLRNSYFIHKFISVLELYLWCFFNNINPFKQTIIFDRNKLDEKSDVLFAFAYCSHIFLNEQLLEKSIIKSFPGKKILHASHFYKQTKRVAENIKKTGTHYVMAEADLKKSPYFNQFFEFIDQVYILPHALRERYKKINPLHERKNLCLALGTLVIEPENDPSNKDFFDFFKMNCLHPMRKIIYENKERLSDLIDCCINFHNEKRLDITNKSKLYNKSRIFKMIVELFFLSEGKEYHRMDIVKKYNEYKMFIAPEESIGLSSINFVEGMACGCAYIGIDHPMYTDLGMVDKQNYIAYDGTLEDLKSKIRYYKDHPKELEAIAQKGYEFARQRFSEARVTNDFLNYLNRLISLP